MKFKISLTLNFVLLFVLVFLLVHGSSKKVDGSNAKLSSSQQLSTASSQTQSKKNNQSSKSTDKIPQDTTSPIVLSQSYEMQILYDLISGNPNDTRDILRNSNSFITKLYSKSPDEAIEFTLNLPNGLIKNSLLGQISEKLPIYPNDQIIPLLNSVSEKNQIQAVLGGIIDQIRGKSDAIQIIAWYNSQINDESKLALLNVRVAPTIFETNFEQAEKWLLGLEDKTASLADSCIIVNYIDSDPVKAIKLLQLLKDSEKTVRFEAIAPIFVKVFSKANPQDCLKWTLQLPDDTTQKKDLIAKSFSQLSIYNFSLAQEKLQEVSDVETRKEISRQVPNLFK